MTTGVLSEANVITDATERAVDITGILLAPMVGGSLGLLGATGHLLYYEVGDKPLPHETKHSLDPLTPETLLRESSTIHERRLQAELEDRCREWSGQECRVLQLPDGRFYYESPNHASTYEDRDSLQSVIERHNNTNLFRKIFQ